MGKGDPSHLREEPPSHCLVNHLISLFPNFASVCWKIGQSAIPGDSCEYFLVEGRVFHIQDAYLEAPCHLPGGRGKLQSSSYSHITSTSVPLV